MKHGTEIFLGYFFEGHLITKEENFNNNAAE
jgi:hypothetical protein